MKPCGLYRTTAVLGAIPAGHLVYFHNHSDEGPPIVLMPLANRNNRWTFSTNGRLIVDDEQLATLAALKPEGLYRVRNHFHLDDGRVVGEDSLLQLGYNRAAEPIAFFPRVDTAANALAFPPRGVKLSATVYDLLAPVRIAGPRHPRPLH